ncbi:LysE/ArgO family amino acid transporter [Kytococcus sp. HMSC28H12]|uniref:LysE/ArgO family amino acid transporter n=1 Tax=Kytococcus sp. HMSC28H12 TaxID=1581067 RepID=UPI0008B228B3|nr:LysE family transporter [Kytococcus sp. HMSC28H12]OFS12659.1 amino acid transporter [Kytococcus sp. HMSC28H12]
MENVSIVASGLVTGIGLIAAVGAQGAYLLRRGLMREHVTALVVFCALSDIVIIGASVLGIGAVIEQFPAALGVVRRVGAAFLVAFALACFRRAARPSPMVGSGGSSVGLRRALATMAAFTWLNPHLWLDTVLLGTLANGYGADGRWFYYAGLCTASVVWFTAVGYGSARLAPVFARPRSWQVLDTVVGTLMLVLGTGLVLQ